MPLPKSQELRIRGIISRVHERRIAESLARVEEALARWRSGQDTVFAVDEAIRQHQMRSKRYWTLYANAAATSPEVHYILDEALEMGIITTREHTELVNLRPSKPPRRP